MICLILAALFVLAVILAAGGGVALIGAWLRSRPCPQCIADGVLCDECMDDELRRMGW